MNPYVCFSGCIDDFEGLPSYAGKMALSTGEIVSLFNLPASALTPEVLGHALTNINRYTGHSRVPWSITQHSLLVASLCPRHLRLEGLLHDASEAFVNDLASPVKHLRGLDGYRKMEEIVEAQIVRHYGLLEMNHPSVKEADMEALAIESRLLFPESAWSLFPEPPVGWQEFVEKMPLHDPREHDIYLDKIMSRSQVNWISAVRSGLEIRDQGKKKSGGDTE